jgi:hypothetical protein
LLVFSVRNQVEKRVRHLLSQERIFFTRMKYLENLAEDRK